jgi:hypothetical protein
MPNSQVVLAPFPGPALLRTSLFWSGYFETMLPVPGSPTGLLDRRAQTEVLELTRRCVRRRIKSGAGPTPPLETPTMECLVRPSTYRRSEAFPRCSESGECFLCFGPCDNTPRASAWATGCPDSAAICRVTVVVRARSVTIDGAAHAGGLDPLSRLGTTPPRKVTEIQQVDLFARPPLGARGSIWLSFQRRKTGKRWGV